MISLNDRKERLEQLERKTLDLVVIGGGITGAGILCEAARAGLRAALFEARDFAWGTSSRSSKMVHGGLRYLAQGQFGLIAESVAERERFLNEAPGLVEPRLFFMPIYGSQLSKFTYEIGLSLYDIFAGRRTHSYHSHKEMLELIPDLKSENMLGGFSYEDAQTDDARLVLRVLSAAKRAGAIAMNYTPVTGLITERGGVVGVEIRDDELGATTQVRATVVVNATGAKTDYWRTRLGSKALIRPLRGSHIVFSSERFPIMHVVAFKHPLDGRNVFACPWNRHVLVGTTDLDHREPLDREPNISAEEASYLMMAANFAFPDLRLEIPDVTAAWAGVRPVVGSGANKDPSKESRDSLVLEERGLISVAGGKLTTFRSTAHQVLETVAYQFGTRVEIPQGPFFHKFDPLNLPNGLSESTRNRLAGYYGNQAPDVLKDAKPDDCEVIPDTSLIWAEIRYAARQEDVVHLDDLMLRRARFGFTLRDGGAHLLEGIRTIAQSEMGWDDQRWLSEEAAYLRLIREAYSLPPAGSIPDWKTSLQHNKSS
jgi:glycerol-3-phosphate dehydrogenase